MTFKNKNKAEYASQQKGHLGPRAMMFVALMVFLVPAVLISGCTTATHDIQVPLSVPARFSESGHSPLPDQWWLSFKDPVLSKLMDQALANNFSLKTAWDRLNQAEALAGKAGAALFPTLNGEAQTSRNLFFEDGNSTESHSYSLGFSTSYEVDLWGRIQASRNAAEFEARASAQDLLATAMTLSSQVADTWYQLVEQYGQLSILDEQVATNKKVLELVTLKFRTGQVGIADMLQQRQLIESNQGERDLALARAGVLKHQLAILLGYPPRQNVAPRINELIDLPPIPQSGLPAELIQNRPDIRSAMFSVKAADSDLAEAIANRFPRLSLTAGFDTTGVNSSDLFNNWLATLAANLTAPLVDGGLRRAEIDRTRAAAAEALHTYGQTILEALGEVENALIQEQRQRNFIDSIDRQLALAGQVIERLREKYLQGTVEYLRVLDALLSFQKLQRSLLTARQDLVQYRIDLCLAIGTGWTLDQPGKYDNSKDPEITE